MKFYQVFDPYYALIKAKSREKAKDIYIENVVDDEDGLLLENLVEIDRDSAVVMYSRGSSEDKEVIPVKEIVDDIQSDEEFVMLFDGALL